MQASRIPQRWIRWEQADLWLRRGKYPCNRRWTRQREHPAATAGEAVGAVLAVVADAADVEDAGELRLRRRRNLQ